MLTRFIRAVQYFIFPRCVPVYLAGILIFAASPLWAQTFDPTLTIGAGIQGSYEHMEPVSGPSVDQFALDHLRLYFSGDITKNISAMVNADYSSVTNTMEVVDAVGEFHDTPKFNVWFGRFVPPSDRDNYTGPFYANLWAMYHDGVQDGYPTVYQGRDNGIAYWGDFKAGVAKIKVSLGAFDGGSLGTGSTQVLAAGRVQIDFWDPEGGYYLNSTYYGDKNLLAIAGATQEQNGNTATTVDFLMEKKVLNGGAFTIESEYSDYNRLGGYDSNYTKSQGAYGLASFLFPKQIGIGKFEVLGKYAQAQFTKGIPLMGETPRVHPSYRQQTTDAEVGYIIKQFDARVFAFGENVAFNGVNTNYWMAGLGLQLQLSKQILGLKKGL
jgi:hypothetical protein